MLQEAIRGVVVESKTDFVKLAYEWHSGQWSALYKFACNWGRILDAEHATQLEGEIQDCLDSGGHSCKNVDDLNAFLEYVRGNSNG